MNETAPVTLPLTNLLQEIITENFDFENINLFNLRIQICARCEHCVENINIPFCSEQNLPLAVTANRTQCPIGKW